MIRRTVILSVCLFFTALPFASCDDKTPKAGAGAGTEMTKKISAPDIALQDLSGKTWRLKDQRGKVVLIDFTTTWCPWCIKDIPNLKKIHERYKNSGFEFVAIYINESKRKVSSFAQKKALPYKILLDPEGKAASTYGVRGVPTKVVVDRDGNILCWMCSDEEALLEKLLRK